LTNSRAYVGKTTRGLELRKAEHKYEASVSTNYPLYNAINKYGFDNFTFDVIYTAKDLADLNEAEKQYIQTLNTLKPEGYNLALGGEGIIFTEETRKKMSESRKILLSNKENHPNFGKSSGRAIKVLCLNNGIEYVSANKAAKELNLDCSSIIKVCKKKYIHTKGYSFKYV